MKNLKTSIAIIAISLLSITSVAAKNTEPLAVTNALRADIVKLLGQHNFDLGNTSLQAEITIMVNNQNELVVISVDSKSKLIADFATRKLNYKKVAIKGLQKGTLYTMPLKIE